MARIVAIDYGAKRVGVATTDPLQIIATALDTVPAADIIGYLKRYCASEKVELFVVGEPFRADGSHSDIETEIKVFIKNLQKALPDIPVSRQDESYTSVKAQEALVQSNVKKKDRRSKKFLDSASATLILQEYLNSRG